MTTETEVTTIRLPQTGLHVPDAAFSVAAYRQRQGRDGVAFTASLRLRNKKVGVIENDGHGGETFFLPDSTAFGYLQLREYARLCRTEEDAEVDAEDLLNTLIEEQQAAKWVTDAVKKGLLALRQMEHSLYDVGGDPLPGLPPRPTRDLATNKPGNQAQTRQLAAEILKKYPVGEHGWWQMWNGSGWHDISPRPAYLSKELYA